MRINEETLIQYGVSKEYISETIERKLLTDHHDYYLYDCTDDTLVNNLIPVEKIIGIGRLTPNFGRHRFNISFWKTLQEESSNINNHKFKNIQTMIETHGLQHFHDWIENDSSEFDNFAHYYEEEDVFFIVEGQHRAMWAILTGAKYYKVNTTYIHRLNKHKVQKFEEICKPLENYPFLLQKLFIWLSNKKSEGYDTNAFFYLLRTNKFNTGR
ncbi:hypothetical protein bcgnr5390_11940 [Bacillus luti]|nr:hypothetical protein BC2903_28960 [Bacillus cereus]